MANANLKAAKSGKNDEFYTQYHDIEVEMNAYLDFNPKVFSGKTVLLPCDDPEWSNFTRYFAAKFDELGLKKLISTSYAPYRKKFLMGSGEFSAMELTSPQFDADKSKTHGKIFVLDRDLTGDGHIDIDDLQWEYLEGDGDFRSDEVTRLCDGADIIITNPPFSLFREFLAWIVKAEKKFIIIGNMNAITYKETFPLIKENKMWLGYSIHSGDREFAVPDEYPLSAAGWRIDENGQKYIRVKGVRWFTNIDHGRRHEKLSLMSMDDNLKFNKKLRGKTSYDHYDNYDAIEVPYTDAIPSDYLGVMGVPISFLDKYNPEQFEILGITSGRDEFEARPTKRYLNPIQINKNGSCTNGSKANTRATLLLEEIPSDIYYVADNASRPFQILYARILIRHLSIV